MNGNGKRNAQVITKTNSLFLLSFYASSEMGNLMKYNAIHCHKNYRNGHIIETARTTETSKQKTKRTIHT